MFTTAGCLSMPCSLQPTQVKPKILKNFTGCVAIQGKGVILQTTKGIEFSSGIGIIPIFVLALLVHQFLP